MPSPGSIDPLLHDAAWSRTDPDVVALADVEQVTGGGNASVYASTLGGQGVAPLPP